MSEKNNPGKKDVDTKGKVEEHKKSAKASSDKINKENSNDTHKNVQKTGTKDDDWNDPTGNSHLANKS